MVMGCVCNLVIRSEALQSAIGDYPYGTSSSKLHS